jgi:hypothetical protein
MSIKCRPWISLILESSWYLWNLEELKKLRIWENFTDGQTHDSLFFEVHNDVSYANDFWMRFTHLALSCNDVSRCQEKQLFFQNSSDCFSCDILVLWYDRRLGISTLVSYIIIIRKLNYYDNLAHKFSLGLWVLALISNISLFEWN